MAVVCALLRKNLRHGIAGALLLIVFAFVVGLLAVASAWDDIVDIEIAGVYLAVLSCAVLAGASALNTDLSKDNIHFLDYLPVSRFQIWSAGILEAGATFALASFACIAPVLVLLVIREKHSQVELLLRIPFAALPWFGAALLVRVRTSRMGIATLLAPPFFAGLLPVLLLAWADIHPTTSSDRAPYEFATGLLLIAASAQLFVHRPPHRTRSWQAIGAFALALGALCLLPALVAAINVEVWAAAPDSVSGLEPTRLARDDRDPDRVYLVASSGSRGSHLFRIDGASGVMTHLGRGLEPEFAASTHNGEGSPTVIAPDVTPTLTRTPNGSPVFRANLALGGRWDWFGHGFANPESEEVFDADRCAESASPAPGMVVCWQRVDEEGIVYRVWAQHLDGTILWRHTSGQPPLVAQDAVIVFKNNWFRISLAEGKLLPLAEAGSLKVAFSKDLSRLLSWEEGALRITNTSNGRLVRKIATPWKGISVSRGFPAETYHMMDTLHVDPDLNFALYAHYRRASPGSYSPRIEVINLKTGSIRTIRPGGNHQLGAEAFAGFSVDGQFASFAFDRRIVRIDLQRGTSTEMGRALGLPIKPHLSALSSDHSRAVVWGEREARILEMGQEETVRVLHLGKDAVSVDVRQLMWLPGDRVLCVGEHRVEIHEPDGSVRPVHYVPPDDE